MAERASYSAGPAATAPGLVSLIVIATGPVRQAMRAVNVALEQVSIDVELVVLHESADTRAALETVPGADGRRMTFAGVGGLTPGRARNAAVASCGGEWVCVIDGGERLQADYLGRCRTAFDADPSLVFAGAPGALWAGAEMAGSRDVAVADLVTGAWAMSGATLVRTEAVRRAGGYDEGLAALVDWELLLRLVTGGDRGVLLPLDVRRLDRDDVAMLEGMRADRYLPAVRAIVSRYRATFDDHAVHVLTGREAVARRLWGRERALVGRRDERTRELAAATQELAALREQLAQEGERWPSWSDLRRVTPLSRNWGLDRGRPIDRFYIERFIAAHRTDIRGRVLELLDAGLTQTFGGDRVRQADVLDIDPGNDRATIVGDLRAAVQIPDASYDCVVLTQTLHLIDDMPAAVRQVHRILKPGGVLLVTLPCASMVAEEYGEHGDYWRVLPSAAQRLFGALFDRADLEVAAHGNVLATTAFLYGLSCEEMTEEELAADDPAYPLIVTVRAVKQRRAVARAVSAPAPTPAILLYHRVATCASDVHSLAVPASIFRSQLEHLARHRRVVPLGDLARAAARGEPWPDAVALTFDDGYLDNLRVAAPLLAELSLPATFFLTSESLNRERRFWWDVLEAAILHYGSGDLVTLRVGGDEWTRPLTDRRLVHDELYGLLKASGPAVRDDLVRQLVAWCPEAASAATRDSRPVVLEELRELASMPGVDIGAHSVHHLDLATVTREQLFQEVFECRSMLERAVERRVTGFAYPFGSLSPAAVGMARAAGYDYAVTCEARVLRPYEQAHRLPRLQVPAAEGTAFTEWLDSFGHEP